MSRNTGERWFFLFFSFVVLIFSASYVPTVYGNDPASIERYLAVHEGRLLGDHVEILAVEDVGADRFVVFRLETKRPDARYVVRFASMSREIMKGISWRICILPGRAGGFIPTS